MNQIKAKTRSFLRNSALDVLGFFSKPSSGVHILNGHLLTTKEELDSSFFDKQLELLSRNSTIIPFNEAVEIIKSKKQLNQSVIAFSFDDGFEECYTHIAPTLEKYNGYAAFFIPPNFIDGDEEYITTFLRDNVHQKNYKRPMNWEQITELHQRGHIIGAHTMDHVRVSEIIDEEQLEYQIGACRNTIESKVHNICNNFAFTYGHFGRDFNLKSIEVAEKYYDNIFSDSRIYTYYCCDTKIINRHHAEPYWKAKHINYFISKRLHF